MVGSREYARISAATRAMKGANVSIDPTGRPLSIETAIDRG